MTAARNPISDLKAIAAMPGLEELAEVIAPFTGGGKTNPTSILIYTAGQWALGSRSKLTSTLRFETVWPQIQATAKLVGRTLPDNPPTHDQLRHVRDRADGHLGRLLSDALPAAMAPLVRSIGLLPENTKPRFDRPERRNTIYSDGTDFKPLSEVLLDPVTGELHGSRSTGRGTARIAPRHVTPGGTDGGAQIVVSLVGVHGPLQLQRATLAVGITPTHREMECSMELFERVHDAYGSSVHAFNYDTLITGSELQRVMRRGVMPIADMRNAQTTGEFVILPEELRTLCGRTGKPKVRAKIYRLPVARHWIGATDCVHHPWSLDGAVVLCGPEELRPSIDSIAVDTVGHDFVPDASGLTQRLLTTYRIPCRHGSFLYPLDLSGNTVRIGRAKGDYIALAEYVRPISITGDHALVRGSRSDVESTNKTLKSQCAQFGRAMSLSHDDFLSDLVGGALWINATSWDVHAGRVTDCGLYLAQMIARKTG